MVKGHEDSIVNYHNALYMHVLLYLLEIQTFNIIMSNTFSKYNKCTRVQNAHDPIIALQCNVIVDNTVVRVEAAKASA